nr:hypothetical protein [Chlamydiota bacterium]
MFIQERFTNGVNPYTSQVDHQESTAAISYEPTAAEVEIPRETLSKAVLDRQSDGALRWMTFNRFGAAKYRIFENEKFLDYHLSQNERVDIWEIEDKRGKEPKTIYKCCDVDDTTTFSTKEELYREIALGTDHGVFSIHDLDTHKEIYIQQKRGWFQYGFEEVSLKQAQKTILTREIAREQGCKSYALGIAALAATPVVVGIGKTFSISWEELTTSVSLSSNHFANALDKTATFVSTALLTYGIGSINRGPGKSIPKALPLAILGTLLWSRPVEAQLCPVFAGSYDTPGIAWDIVVSGSYAYFADDIYGLQIIDVTNVANPVRVGGYDTPGLARDVALSGSYAYVADSGSLQIIDVSNVANAVRVGWCNTSGNARGVVLSGSYAYVAVGTSGLQIIDVSNVVNPVHVGWCDTPGYAYGVAVSGSYAYIADDSGGGLQIIDVSNVTNPVRVGWYNTPGYASDVVVFGKYAYVADATSGLQIIDVSNVVNPVRVGWYDTSGNAYDIAVSGNYAYVGDSGGLQIIDVSNVINPVSVGRYNVSNRAFGVAVSGRYAYLAVYTSGIQVIDVSICPSSNSGTFFSAISTNTSTSSDITTLPLSTDSTSNNPRSLRIGLGVGIAGLICLGVSGTTLFYLLKKRKESADLETNASENNISFGSATHKSFELRPIVKRGYKEIGEEYYQLSTIDKTEAKGIYQQTGHLIVFPEGEKKLKYEIGKGHFGAIKVAQRIEDGQ